MNCEAVREALGAWLDREVGASQAREIEAHLGQCVPCSRERGRIEHLELALKGALTAQTATPAFDPFWQGVRARIEEDVPWHRRFSEWLSDTFTPRRLAWVVPVVVVFALGLFSARQFYPGWPWGSAVANLTFVESIDAHGGSVALFRESETRTTVIWLYPSQEGENESSEDAGRGNDSF